MLKIFITVSKPCLIARELFSCSLDILNILEKYTFVCVCVCVCIHSTAFPFFFPPLRPCNNVFYYVWVFKIIFAIPPYTGKKKNNCLAYWNLQTWSLHREGKIIPIAHLTRGPVHLPTSKNMEMNMIDRLAPIWTFIHHHLISLLQAQISSTFLANNHQMPKKTFIIIFWCRNLGYMFLRYHQKMCWCLRENVMESKTLVIFINDLPGWPHGREAEMADEIAKAQVAQPGGDRIFEKIICISF